MTLQQTQGRDLAKRQRVMQRSIRLGHCICDPKKACPCELFKQRDVCLCAGEQLEPVEAAGPVRLTKLVEKAGCASKIDQRSLRRILSGLPELDDPRVLLGVAAGDDAGVFRLDDRNVLVQTVDVFSPSLDDPYEFGQVAAANSLSDIYAMGGTPLTALSIIGFPLHELPDEVMREILRGGLETMAEAGVPVIGGHSIRDGELKAGFAVTGRVDPDRLLTNAAARPGDVLLLTKPLGTGILSFACQIDRTSAEAAEAMSKSMRTLNRAAAEVMVRHGAHAATDVTGFGLAGHLAAMAEAAGVDVEIMWDDLPLLPGLLEAVAAGIVPGGVERNRESSAASVVLGPGADERMLEVCLDPQTSGGLLMAVAADVVEDVLADLRAAGVAQAAIIGRVRGRGQGKIHLLTDGRRKFPVAATSAIGKGVREMSEEDRSQTGQAPANGGCCDETTAAASRSSCCCQGEGESAASASSCCSDSSAEESCCGDSPSGGSSCCCSGQSGGADGGADGTERSASAVRSGFVQFLQQASQPAGLDAATKEAVSLALSIAMRCEPCVKVHMSKSRQMGFSDEEIEEIANLGIAFGGAPAMMLYHTLRRDK